MTIVKNCYPLIFQYGYFIVTIQTSSIIHIKMFDFQLLLNNLKIFLLFLYFKFIIHFNFSNNHFMNTLLFNLLYLNSLLWMLLC